MTAENNQLPEIDLSTVRQDGGMTTEELNVFRRINYSILEDENFLDYKTEIINAIHLIQCVFMWRVVIRLSRGEFWVKSDLPYENNVELIRSSSEKYSDIVLYYHSLEKNFQNLEPYHPSHLDDIRRGINQIFEVINKVEKSLTDKNT